MSNGRNKTRKGYSDRDSGQFMALPFSVMNCSAYLRLSHPARSLLLEIALQYVRDNNGRLLASSAHLSKRGWNSNDVITRAKRELLVAGFIFETVQGHRPNKASWYAVTWQPLDKLPGYDAGTAETFERSAYKASEPLRVKPTRDEIYARHPTSKNATLKPCPGVEGPSIAPSLGAGRDPATPYHGVISPVSTTRSAPPRGHHLERPSTALETAH